MNSDLYFEGKKFISSSRAAKISGYVNDYIGQLCRDSKLECRMVGRSWYVSLESLIKHKKANGTGTRSLGKLVPNVEALFEVPKPIVASPEIVQQGQQKKVPESLVVEKAPVISAVKTNFGRSLKVSYPIFLEPLAVSKQVEAPVLGTEAITSRKASKKVYFLNTARFAAVALAIFFAILGFRFGFALNPASQQEYAIVLNNISPQLEASVMGSLQAGFGKEIALVYDTIRNWLISSRQTILVLSGQTPAPSVQQTSPSSENNFSVASTPKQGLVVVPLNANTDKSAIVTKVKNTFSDVVSVKPDDNQSGVITPVFKKSKGDDYLYVLVPITN